MTEHHYAAPRRPDVGLLFFAPIHKRAMGLSVGIVFAALVVGLTVFHLFVPPPHGGPSIELLSQYFYGYTISWRGAIAGMFWAFVTGFTLGWFGAFVRNVVVAVSVFALKTRAELSRTAGFLDHI